MAASTQLAADMRSAGASIMAAAKRGSSGSFEDDRQQGRAVDDHRGNPSSSYSQS